MYDKIPINPEGGNYSGASAQGTTARQFDRANESLDAVSENIRSHAMRKANESANEAARHKRLAEKLTPEIETVLWCWSECLALGLIDVRVIMDAAAREERLRRDRF